MKATSPIRRAGLELGYRLGGWPRRSAALACLLLAAVAVADQHHSRPAPASRTVVVAAHDLGAGRRLAAADIRVVRWATIQIPTAARSTARQVIGATVAAAMNAGEPITSARLRGAGITQGLAAGMVAVTVALANPATLELIQAGDEVDLLGTTAADPRGGTTASGAPPSAHIIAAAVRVLAVLPAASAPDSNVGGLVVAASRLASLALAAATGAPIVATLRGPP
jgi:pilus assembly protein CpaB